MLKKTFILKRCCNSEIHQRRICRPHKRTQCLVAMTCNVHALCLFSFTQPGNITLIHNATLKNTNKFSCFSPDSDCWTDVSSWWQRNWLTICSCCCVERSNSSRPTVVDLEPTNQLDISEFVCLSTKHTTASVSLKRPLIRRITQ